MLDEPKCEADRQPLGVRRAAQPGTDQLKLLATAWPVVELARWLQRHAMPRNARRFFAGLARTDGPYCPSRMSAGSNQDIGDRLVPNQSGDPLESRGDRLSSDFDDPLLRRIAGADEPPVDTPAIGTVLDGKYRLERILGRGGMGIVFAAQNVAADREVAVKWMLRRGDGGELRRRFALEARAAGRIRHPNVVDIYDV